MATTFKLFQMKKKNISDKSESLLAFERLLTIMDELREKCPWDKKQTIETLRHLTIEETYELADAILENDFDNIKKELGDLLLHIVFYARIGREKNKFTITDVIQTLCEKLIYRHPHIYGDVKVANENEVKQNWEKLKLKGGTKSVLEGVPASLPSLIKAMRIQEKARGVGFDWENKEQVWEKVQEELNEFKEEIEKVSNPQSSISNPQPLIEEEFGDLLFSLVNYARFINVNPEEALERTNKKFIRRFQYLEQEVKKSKKVLHDMTLAEMDVYWNKAKKKYRN